MTDTPLQGKVIENNLTPIDDTEEEEIKQALEDNNYRISPKFLRFIQLYNDEKSETFGNATRSVLKAYKLDEKTQYNSAMVIASQNLRKLKIIGRDYAEKKGYSIQKIITVAYINALKGNTQWWQEFKQLTGINEEKAAVNINFNQQNNTFNVGSKEERKELNDKFQKFLEQQS